MCKVNNKNKKIKMQSERNNCMENNFVDELLRTHRIVCRVTMFSTHTHTCFGAYPLQNNKHQLEERLGNAFNDL